MNSLFDTLFLKDVTYEQKKGTFLMPIIKNLGVYLQAKK